MVELYYTETDTEALFANKVSNTGIVSLLGLLDIGTTYTNPGIICNAEVGSYTGFAECYAAGSYDMFLRFQTTYPNGCWMYLKIKNDNYLQLSGSDNKVTIYKDTAINGNLYFGGSGASSKIKVHAANNGYTGCAELKAQSSYDMFLNLQTTPVNGGWMYFKINNDNLLLLSSSGQFVK